MATGKRQRPLTIDEYERDFRDQASDLALVERIYYGGIADNQLRTVLWPYLFGLVKRRGRFKLAAATTNGHSAGTNGYQNGSFNGNGCNGAGLDESHSLDEESLISDDEEDDRWNYVEHEENIERWRELARMYSSYQTQWESILPDQELRFSTFRERKSLIERDVVRSDRSHPFYADNSHNSNSLTKLLMTYMMYDFDIGYLQGMSDLAAPILYMFNGDLVKSFWIFVEAMKLFRRNFEYSQKTIHFQLSCLFRLVRITDPKFAQYLYENESSNCFFAFRCIVCQFKRELMRGQHGEDDDYAKVLSLWDTIWSVQRRHELLAKSKIVHTFTIANGRRSAANADGKQQKRHHHHNHHHQHRHSHQGRHMTTATSQLATSLSNTKTAQLNGHSTTKPTMAATATTHINGSPKGATCITNNHSNNCNGQNGAGLQHNGTNGVNGERRESAATIASNNSTYMSNYSLRRTMKRHSLSKVGNLVSNSNGVNASGDRSSPGTRSLVTNLNGYSTLTNGCANSHSNKRHLHNSNNNNHSPQSPLSLSPMSLSSNEYHYQQHQQQESIKQEQVVYTKETFYSSFDPNQADVPRFELSETEKFVLSLCLSLIRRERNHIMLNQLDASEIHQHFISPDIASDLDNFIESAYHIYHYLNTDCDMKLLVKGANELVTDFCADVTDGVDGLTTAIATATGDGTVTNKTVTNKANGISVIGGRNKTNAGGCSPKDDTADTADTYDLLKDYLIISPTSYNTSPRFKYSIC